MNDKEIDLTSVHWTHGMLLTPEHFIRQEQYFDSSLLWLARYATDAYGLVGIGPRGDVAERGAARHDPIVSIEDDGEQLRVSVTQGRGISPSGDLIEIDAGNALHASFPKNELESAQELGVYIVTVPHRKTVTEGDEDAANPQIKPARRQTYQLKLDVTAAESAHSVLVSRVRRVAGTLRFERVGEFIPMCTTLVGHSALHSAWTRLRDQLTALADRYMQLHKAMVEYIALANERSINTLEDNETLQFVGRMVMTLEAGIHDAINPVQSPKTFLQQLYRVVRSAAVYLDLSPPTHRYFQELAQVGVTEFETLLEQERRTLLTSRNLTMRDDLTSDVRHIELAFDRLRRLEEALEGKYLDYRMSAALEALTFFFDRRTSPPALYQSVMRPARPQSFGDDLTFVFAPLQLDGRQTYRIVLIREESAEISKGTQIQPEIRVNASSGQGFDSVYPHAVCELTGQRNFAIDFEAPPGAHTIQDVRVILNVGYPIRSCLLYQRRRLSARVNPASNAPAPPAPPPMPKPPVFAPANEQSGTSGKGGRLTDVSINRREPEQDEPTEEPPVRRRRLDFGNQ